MRNNTNLEIELPWQIKLVLWGAAIAAAAFTVGLGWIILQVIANNFLQAAFASLDTSMQPTFSLAVVWPMPLLAFWILSMRFYLAIKRMLVGRLTML